MDNGGTELKRNVRDHWWRSMTQFHENIVGIDAAIFMHPTTWKASGHVDNFSDPMIDNKDSKKRYRVDHLLEAHADELEKQGDEHGARRFSQEWMNYLQQVTTTD
jgi:glycyl-tRNA synthetase